MMADVPLPTSFPVNVPSWVYPYVVFGGGLMGAHSFFLCCGSSRPLSLSFSSLLQKSLFLSHPPTHTTCTHWCSVIHHVILVINDAITHTFMMVTSFTVHDDVIHDDVMPSTTAPLTNHQSPICVTMCFMTSSFFFSLAER